MTTLALRISTQSAAHKTQFASLIRRIKLLYDDERSNPSSPSQPTSSHRFLVLAQLATCHADVIQTDEARIITCAEFQFRLQSTSCGANR